MPTNVDTEIREALSAIRDVEPTDADVRRATLAARPRPRAWRARRSRFARAAIATGAVVAAAFGVVAVLQSASPEHASAKDVLLDAAAVAAEQPARSSDGYRYTRLVQRLTRASTVHGCATCFASVTVEQPGEQWIPSDWREGTRRDGAARILERSGDAWRQRELIDGGVDIPHARLLADPVLQHIPFAELPRDPVALRNLLQAAVMDLRWAGPAKDTIRLEQDEVSEGRHQTPLQTRSLMISGVINILSTANITPQLRAALFRVLATVDGARGLGRVTDPLGRWGEGVAFHVDPDDSVVDHPASELRIIVAPDTGELLAVSDVQRDPSGRPAPKGLRVRRIEWIPAQWTAYVRTDDVAKIGERP